ncbi:MAG: hypothetical protein ABFD89_26540, partial [Bryobacteraceae bacterium]
LPPDWPCQYGETGVSILDDVNDLIASHSALSRQNAALRAALETIPVDLINAIENGEAPAKIFLSVESCKLIAAAALSLTPPAAVSAAREREAWLTPPAALDELRRREREAADEEKLRQIARMSGEEGLHEAVLNYMELAAKVADAIAAERKEGE